MTVGMNVLLKCNLKTLLENFLDVNKIQRLSSLTWRILSFVLLLLCSTEGMKGHSPGHKCF
jgi:hypothetical protein